ncbi:hypothetical protein L211DRAFT_781221 [Terfezia boudieri ATCC MYA-4762]|uniref:Integral membrane bound transporter domain-containing protein n=1 Tax=Terfezia boudieri ATCC MYA-4762 TaxID=1051890 RepID=A0A3N4M0X5_9PEZI|nr:hypothetical protein L211DRAFT_781221 [Terfezia boudieri ATCC MYA-4762]
MKKVTASPLNMWKFIQGNPQCVKRMLKVAITLSGGIALTINHPLVDIWGKNPFLLGTTAIYLFPKQSVGAQVVSTAIALLGALCGIAYANLAIFLAGQTQSSAPMGYIGEGRRALLFTSFVLCAFICGYIRSKYPRFYLLTIFAMIVNMFALIWGINDFGYVFQGFFVVMAAGAGWSMLVNLCLWPEDHGSILRADIDKALSEARQVVSDVEQSIWAKGFGEVNCDLLGGAVRNLAASFKESNYEISLSRVDARDLLALSGKLETLVDLVKVYNCAAMPMYGQESHPTEETLPVNPRSSTSDLELTKCKAISFAFLEAVRIIDRISQRITAAYNAPPKIGPHTLPLVDTITLHAHIETVSTALLQERESRTELNNTANGVEEVAFTDLIGTVVIEMLETVEEAARKSIAVQSTGRLSLFLPIKFRKEKGGGLEKKNIGSSDEEEYAEFHDLEDSIAGDDDGDDDTATELVLLRPEKRWYTSLSLSLSRILSRIKHSRHIKYAIKFSIVMGVLSLPAYIKKNYIWYENLHAQWALISAMVAMETTRGMTFRTAGMKVCGAVAGGVSAFISMYISRGYVWGDVTFALFVGLLIGYLVINPSSAKAGTVFALAFNIIIGVAQTSPDHDTIAALAKRLITLPIGLVVAMLIHVGVFPFHARAQLGRAISTSMDWLHHLLYAIELAGEDNRRYPEQFSDVVSKTKRRVRFARGLVPATRYEISLAGCFPVEKFQGILDRLGGIVLLIVGTRNVREDGPILLDPRFRGMVEAYGREQLLGSLCNDLLVLSHTLSARLYMPRHNSHSSIVLSNYIHLFAPFCLDPHPRPTDLNSISNYADVGRLTTLVNEMDLLREEIDNLITESHVSPRAKEAFPQLSANVYVSATLSRCAPRSQLHLDGGRTGNGRLPSRVGSRSGSRVGSRGPSRSGSRVGTPLTSPRRLDVARSRSRSGERWNGGREGGSGGGPQDASNLV